MKHTPGPWMVDPDDQRLITTPELYSIGETVGKAVLYSDARLIATAPDLLAALIGAEKCLEQSITHLPPDTLAVFCGEWLGSIRETIKKATGGE